jgi:O-antigen/teichoic acid export membrane protein
VYDACGRVLGSDGFQVPFDREPSAVAGMSSLLKVAEQGDPASGVPSLVQRGVKLLFGTAFARQASLVLASSVLVNICNYLFHLLNSRRLGVEEYGVLASLVALLSLASAPCTIVQLVVAKTAAEIHASRDDGRLNRLATIVLWVAAGSLAFIFLAGALSFGWLGHFFNLNDPIALLMAVLAIGAVFLLPGARGLFQGTHQFFALAISFTIEGIVKIVVGVGLVYAGFGVRGALAGMALGAFASFVYSLTKMRPYWRIATARLKLHPVHMLQTISGTTIATIAYGSLSFADVLAVKHFFDATDAGVYGALSLVGKIFLFAVSFIPTVMLPAAIRHSKSGIDPLPLLLKMSGFAVAISAAGLAVCAVAPAFVVAIVAGGAFVAAAPLLLAYAGAMAILGLANLGIAYKIGLHRFEFVIPLAVVAIAEIIGFSVFHRTLTEIVLTLIVGHTMAFVLVSWRIWVPLVHGIAPTPAYVDEVPAAVERA